MKRRFGLQATIPAADETDLMLKEYHQYWRKTNSNKKESFVPIFSGFREKHLASLDGGPLRLYLFFAFAANNQYGHSWHSIANIAIFFDTQTRTIDNWIKVLVDKKLIYREQKGKKSHTTYLIPYSNTIVRHQLKKNIKEDSQKILDMFIAKIKDRESIYGPIVDVYHFFQWKTNKKNKPIFEGSIQWLVIITKRDDDVLTGHFYSLKNSSHLGISELDVEDVAKFTSPFTFDGQNIQGVALTHDIKLNDSSTDVILELFENISGEDSWDWDEYPDVVYGEIDELYTEQADEADSDEGAKEIEIETEV